MQGRLADLKAHLPADWRPQKILDFGCGTGNTTRALSALFPNAKVVGLDASASAVSYARQKSPGDHVYFERIESLSATGPYDLCYINGVFHHIDPSERPAAMKNIFGALRPGGFLALFENNPWNPGARLVMKNIPFDRGARMLSHRQAQRLAREAGFQDLAMMRSLFYFPRWLAFLRFLEPALAKIPFGAQYYLLLRKRDSHG